MIASYTRTTKADTRYPQLRILGHEKMHKQMRDYNREISWSWPRKIYFKLNSHRRHVNRARVERLRPISCSFCGGIEAVDLRARRRRKEKGSGKLPLRVSSPQSHRNVSEEEERSNRNKMRQPIFLRRMDLKVVLPLLPHCRRLSARRSWD